MSCINCGDLSTNHQSIDSYFISRLPLNSFLWLTIHLVSSQFFLPKMTNSIVHPLQNILVSCHFNPSKLLFHHILTQCNHRFSRQNVFDVRKSHNFSLTVESFNVGLRYDRASRLVQLNLVAMKPQCNKALHQSLTVKTFDNLKQPKTA